MKTASLYSLFLVLLRVNLGVGTPLLFGGNTGTNNAIGAGTLICSTHYDTVYSTVYDTILVKKVSFREFQAGLECRLDRKYSNINHMDQVVRIHD